MKEATLWKFYTIPKLDKNDKERVNLKLFSLKIVSQTLASFFRWLLIDRNRGSS